MQPGVVGKPAEGALNPTVHVTNKDVKQRQSQYQPLRNTTHHWSPLGHRAVDRNFLRADMKVKTFRHGKTRITESQNHIGWKRPLRSSSPTVNLTLPSPPLHHVPKHLIQTSFEYLQGWRLNHFPGQPVPMLDNPFSEVKFPNIQSKLPLAQLEAVSSHPITCYLGEETDPHLSTPSFQVVVENDEVSPQPPFLQAKQPQFPQPLPIRLVLQTLHQLRCPSLDTLQPLNVSLVGGGPKLNTVVEVRPHQCRVQGHNHFPTPAGHAIFDTSQGAVGLLGHLGTLLAHIQAAVDQHPQVLFYQAAFQPLFPKPVALHGVAVAQCNRSEDHNSDCWMRLHALVCRNSHSADLYPALHAPAAAAARRYLHGDGRLVSTGWGREERDVESASEDARFQVLPNLTTYGQRSHRVYLRKGLATAPETPHDQPPPPAPAQKIENFLEQEPCKP
ncbi:hypothetical protein QYF61_003033 [Mycteria americana]|uniref:Uncharacterized protein n=1 Tax=Mycteria americana TaxID=33587 RepID=A0AAN7NES0_MYCAM|nr:hypothetical protein QYF61_003033 [Mycteria americana]